MNEICNECLKNKECETTCAAFKALYRLWDEQNEKDKIILIRNLKRRMGIRDAEPSRKLRLVATKIINRYSEFDFIHEWNVKIGYVISQERKNGEKIIYADCIMKCDYVYSSTPDEKSSVRLNYKLSLIRENNKYKIISIDSDFNEFDDFKKSVEEKVSFAKISKRDAINKTKEEKIQDIRVTVKYIAGNTASSEKDQTDIETSTDNVTPLAASTYLKFLNK